MLEGLKRWFSGSATAPAPGGDDVGSWAEQRQFAFRSVRGEGFVVDGRTGANDWRLEWGPSQRSYVGGHELRLRAELGLPGDLQVLVLNRRLQETLEQSMFEQYVEDVQTRIDSQTPPEMRWLVMFPKLPAAEMESLRDHFVAVASAKGWLAAWLRGPLTDALRHHAPPPDTPLVLMIGRGRLSLRMALAEPDMDAIKTWVKVFETALREARRVAADSPEAAVASTPASVWGSSAAPPGDTPPG